MAELTSKDRLQPALLDRLTDRAPRERSETRDERVVSMRQLRQSVLRDLTHLLNATSLMYRGDFGRFPLVVESVLGYGLPDLTGKTVSTLDALEVARLLTATIKRFEPRILGHTLRVTPAPAVGHAARPSAIAFLIEGDLWAQPYPERLYFRSELDLEAGKVSVSEQHDGSAR